MSYEPVSDVQSLRACLVIYINDLQRDAHVRARTCPQSRLPFHACIFPQTIAHRPVFDSRYKMARAVVEALICPLSDACKCIIVPQQYETGNVNHARIKSSGQPAMYYHVWYARANVTVGEENRTRRCRPRSANDERIRSRNRRDCAGKILS